MISAKADHSRLPRVRSAIDAGINRGVDLAASVVQATIRAGFGNSPGTKGKPSAPGTPPNVQSNALRSSVAKTDARGGTAYVFVRKNIPYARVHEFGGTFVRKPRVVSGRIVPMGKKSDVKTSTTATYPARPYMRPGVEASKPRAREVFKAETERYVMQELQSMGAIK